ncbi:cisplatin damage response ATP-dependent DNA ligase [Hoeflea sp. YIM 152468]|uniref:cisplatin damage response ATP-dependent DNA ligase n=1 Tax=Hoeflea sp. YIM 152468 TaxID=3031759 RepID=UPI0023DC9CA2|nr:cisplatin damage response ATP-dependent DNA ligase [Hoeflea sp. YIM 152468]MDF1608791.1 cisplatin damage response ATP-dependent DNA ligase [Hoeflea sp. YIM 152468]
MNRFADLLDMLAFTPSRNAKLSLLQDYFRTVPDPERGYALAAIARELDIPAVKPAQLRQLIASRMDAQLFAYSYDYVGDLAETIALAWPEASGSARGRNDAPGLTEVVETLMASSRRQGPGLVEDWLDRLDPSGRYGLLKLVTGGFRMGLSGRLIKQALAAFGGVDVNQIEELWHGLTPPYVELFAWLEGSGEKPVNASAAPFRPVMLSHAIDGKDFEKLDPAEFVAEWKWDGIRVQATSERGISRLYTRTGDDISATFPDLVDAISFDGALDGELLVARPSGAGIETGSFSDLQQRLNRKTVSAKQLREFPAFFRAYDLLQDGAEDLRARPFLDRRTRLEAFVLKLDPMRFDCSEMLEFDNWDDLAALRAEPPFAVIEGVMIKRKAAPYLAGRPKGEWFKWKRDPFLIDAVLMYAQRGHGKRSGFYSDYTFGVWREPGELVPVGKAYFGFTDDELVEIDKYVRNNTVERFGPVRSVRAGLDKGLVFEVAFEGINRSSRHKSGVAMRFPRISRLRWDKPPAEADRLETLERMIDGGP